MKILTGFIAFKHSVFCNGEVMGCEFDSVIGDIKVKLYFPEIIVEQDVMENINLILKCPQIASLQK